VTKEIQWFWRRLFTFLFMGVNTATICWIVSKLDEPDALKWIALALAFANILLAFVYMAGATLVDPTRIKSEAIQTATEVRDIIS